MLGVWWPLTYNLVTPLVKCVAGPPLKYLQKRMGHKLLEDEFAWPKKALLVWMACGRILITFLGRLPKIVFINASLVVMFRGTGRQRIPKELHKQYFYLQNPSVKNMNLGTTHMWWLKQELKTGKRWQRYLSASLLVCRQSFLCSPSKV